MTYVQLGTKAVGSIVKLKENGVAVNYIVVHQGLPSSIYDSSCNGVWLLRQDVGGSSQYDSTVGTDFKDSIYMSYLNNTFLALLDSDIQNKIISAKLPYHYYNGSTLSVKSGSDGLSAKAFPLSMCEVGIDTDVGTTYPDGSVLSHFSSGSASKRIAYYNGAAWGWGTRSMIRLDGTMYYGVSSTGESTNYMHNASSWTRPAMILPTTLWVDTTGLIYVNPPPGEPASITVPENIGGGDTITISWGASTDSNGNLSGYQLYRSTDDGVNWTLVYQGTLLTTTDNIAFGTETVIYRVRAYDTLSAYSGYTTSATRTVINNNAPSAPASITVPNTVSGGKSLTVTWGAATDADSNLAGYSLERSVDGGDFAEIYNGTALSYVDSITKGWKSVAYRVRAYDSYTAYSDYSTSATRTVNNNTAPTISCSYSSGSDLGTKDSGFSISYSVYDEDGDAITVTEALDGVTKSQFIATAGQSYSLDITSDYFMQVLNGSHTLTITANDGTEAVTHKLNFSKLVTKATITLLEPMLADGQITVTVLAVSGSIPADAGYTVEVTNNAKDDVPVWEDCTSAVKNGTNYVFVNATAVNGFAFNFRVTAERANGGDGGYITSIQGGFQ